MISKSMRPKVEGNSVIRKMFEEGKELAARFGEENVYDFSLGNPNLAAPDAFDQAIREVLAEEDPIKVHGYMSNAGFEEVREAVAMDLNERFATAYSAKNVIMSTGAGSALNVALKTILDPGDEVIVFCPYFVEYRNYISNFYAETVEVKAPEDGSFLPNPSGLEKAITEKTKAVIINSPNNPTGVVYPKERLAEIADVLSRKSQEVGHPIYILSDEPYRELVYGGMEVPHIPRIYKDTIVCYSYSKSLSLPGERIGYVLVPHDSHRSDEFITAATIANRIIGIVNAPSLVQLALMRCLKEKADLDFYEKNGSALYKGLTDAGYRCTKPQGAFYLWVKAPCEEGRFVEELKKQNILVTPGSAFAGPGYVRISYCVSPEKIEGSMPGFKRVIERLK